MAKKEVKDYFKIKALSEDTPIQHKHSPGEIIIHLNRYEDLFSSFDPRPFDERSLSDDFLSELEKASKVKEGEDIHIAFFLNEESRNVREEGLIRRRLVTYIQKHKRKAQQELRKSRLRSFKMIAIGTALLFISTYLHKIETVSLWRSLGIVLTEPAGWFIIWTGFERGFTWISDKKKEVAFYKRMENAQITFNSY